MFLESLRFLGRFNNKVAVILKILNVLSTLFNKLKDLRVLTNLKLLHVCQSFQGSFIANQPANRSDKIILLYKAKINRLTVPINKRQHIIPFINIFMIAYDLSVLFRS
jgi:hypothetical protein